MPTAAAVLGAVALVVANTFDLEEVHLVASAANMLLYTLSVRATFATLLRANKSAVGTGHVDSVPAMFL